EIPLGAGRLQDLERVDADFSEDDRQLVHERDVQVTLGVLDHLCGFGNLDAGGAVHAGFDHRSVEIGDAIERPGRIAGDDLGDPGQGVLPVARVDAFRGIAD